VLGESHDVLLDRVTGVSGLSIVKERRDRFRAQRHAGCVREPTLASRQA
jgi:hypothetical protein